MADGKFWNFTDKFFEVGSKVVNGVNNLSGSIDNLNNSSGDFVQNWNNLKPLEVKTNNTVEVKEDQFEQIKKYGLIGLGAFVLLKFLKII